MGPFWSLDRSVHGWCTRGVGFLVLLPGEGSSCRFAEHTQWHCSAFQKGTLFGSGQGFKLPSTSHGDCSSVGKLCCHKEPLKADSLAFQCWFWYQLFHREWTELSKNYRHQPRLSRPERAALHWDADKFLSLHGIVCRNSCTERPGHSWLLFAVLWDLTNSLQVESFDFLLLCMQCRSTAWICGNLAFAKLLMIGIGCRPWK